MQAVAKGCAFVAAGVWASQALSMQVHSRPLEDVVQQAGSVVVADIKEVQVGPASTTMRGLSVGLRVVRVIYGSDWRQWSWIVPTRKADRTIAGL